ncbi:hypothetical protein [Jiangella muralis]|uniref:hypothetical protein n=1 Tax=Jiangella muralis TaxID=702383 RepID=UPI000A9C48A8|nr:hypothetical protein [Jiangella muralis]
MSREAAERRRSRRGAGRPSREHLAVDHSRTIVISGGTDGMGRALALRRLAERTGALLDRPDGVRGR